MPGAWRISRAAFAAVLLLLGPVAGALTPEDGTLSAEQDARYRTLIHELRCLVCQNQTIADSNAELAADLRSQVREQIAAGRTDAQIRHYVTDRYGDFVLYKPPLSARTLLLWTGPFVFVALALLIVLRLLRRRRLARAPEVIDAARLRKVLDEEGG